MFREPVDEQLGSTQGRVGAGAAGDLGRGQASAAGERYQWSEGKFGGFIVYFMLVSPFEG